MNKAFILQPNIFQHNFFPYECTQFSSEYESHRLSIIQIKFQLISMCQAADLLMFLCTHVKIHPSDSTSVQLFIPIIEKYTYQKIFNC